MPSLSPSERFAIMLISLGFAWPAFSASMPRHGKYYLMSDSLLAVFNGVRVFSVPYADIEYVGYTAENAFLGGARYIPFGGGILCLVTRPGFMVTIDFRNSHTVRAGRFLKVCARRVLITVDDPKEFVQNLRSRLAIDETISRHSTP